MEPGVTDLGVALLVILLLIRDVIVPLIKKKTDHKADDPMQQAVVSMAATSKTLAVVLDKMSQEVGDLHDWHAPNGDGIQPWKGATMQVQLNHIERKITDLAQGKTPK